MRIPSKVPPCVRKYSLAQHLSFHARAYRAVCPYPRARVRTYVNLAHRLALDTDPRIPPG